MKKMTNVLAFVASLALAASGLACKNNAGGNGTVGGGGTTVSVTGVKLNYSQIYREQGESFTLTATVEPSNASNKTVTWTTSNGSIATVDNGTVTMTGSTVWESATITCTTADGGKTATCTVTVTQKPTASTPDANGFVTISAGSMPLDSDGSYHVTLTKAYMMCDHEVTQKEWKAVMGNNPSSFSSDPASGEVQENRPVENITWYEAIAYCNERTEKENIKRGSSSDIDYVYFSDSAFTTPYTKDDATSNKLPYMRVDANGKIDATGYRLPTEAEWEIAARGGLTGDVYAGTGDVNKLGDYAWYYGNSDSKTHEVKKKKANGYGLYDMSGNVWEWCWDWYGDYATSATDPTGASSGSYRVLRGSGWGYYASYCRASNRRGNSPASYFNYLGFRLVRTVQ
ncbi:MAG: SUMF1/EgtB/PvdO family nonheme iron enzyme [Treponema sp.]|nr:SUMF1/EgtB/PvdO family nonheme iron enzyme [Treponema sp.]